MRILLVSDLGPPYIGGGERYLIELASRLAARGHEVWWCFSQLPGTSKEEVYQAVRLRRIPIPFAKHFLFPGRQLFPLSAFAPILRIARRVDVMQFNTFVAATFGHLIARLAKRPVLLWCHEMFGELWKLVGRNVIERKLYPVIEKLIAMAPHSHIACPSLYSAQTLRKMGARRAISVIPHGIDFNIFHPRKDVLRKELGLEDTKLFGFTGRLFVRGTGQSKNLLLLLEATKCIVKESPNTKLLLGGIGFEELAPFVNQMGLQDHVVYAGARKFEEVPLFYAACDVIVCPALADGFCFLLAEASACGVPVVATRCGAHPERVIHRKTGFLVEPDASSLADAVLRILWDENLARRMGEAGRKHALRFAWDKSVRKHLQIYEQLLTMH